MKRNTLRMSLLAAAMAATFGIARADTVTSVTVPSDRLEPKCMDTANTQPAGCVPSAPIAQSSSSSTDINLNGSAAKQYPSSPNASSSGSSSTSSTLNVNPGVGVDANASVNNSNANIGADVSPGVNIGSGSSTRKPDTGTSSTQ